jgi:nicotinamidase/pyrazinamidase
LPPDASIISKATSAEKDAYSGFEGTELESLHRARDARRLFVGGLATDYCVLNTVKDARLHNRDFPAGRCSARQIYIPRTSGRRWKK